MNCQSCNQPVPEGDTFCRACGSLAKFERKQYKVVSQRDNSIFGSFHQFNSAGIQQALNELAAVGWRLIAVTQVEAFDVWQGQKQEVLMFLERG